MPYHIEYSNNFLKDAKKMQKRNYDMKLLQKTIETLEHTGTLPHSYNPHKLKGNFVHHWEAHIKPDWLIIWLLNDKKQTITLVRTGSHADLF